jgi:hypothetical protein
MGMKVSEGSDLSVAASEAAVRTARRAYRVLRQRVPPSAGVPMALIRTAWQAAATTSPARATSPSTTSLNAERP